VTAVHNPGSARPSRIVGLALVGIAVVALVLGIVTALGGNGSNGATQPPAPPPPTGGTGQPTAPPTSPAPPQTGQPTSPGPPTQSTNISVPPPPPPENPPDLKAIPVRVFNNGTITGLAARAAQDFQADGWNVVEVGNYSQGIIPTTTAYFRPGTDEESAARELARKFGMRAEPRFAGIADSSPGLIVMITNDYGGK
jgi:hypothetical protein